MRYDLNIQPRIPLEILEKHTGTRNLTSFFYKNSLRLILNFWKISDYSIFWFWLRFWAFPHDSSEILLSIIEIRAVLPCRSILFKFSFYFELVVIPSMYYRIYKLNLKLPQNSHTRKYVMEKSLSNAPKLLHYRPKNAPKLLRYRWWCLFQWETWSLLRRWGERYIYCGEYIADSRGMLDGSRPSALSSRRRSSSVSRLSSPSSVDHVSLHVRRLASFAFE